MASEASVDNLVRGHDTTDLNVYLPFCKQCRRSLHRPEADEASKCVACSNNVNFSEDITSEKSCSKKEGDNTEDINHTEFPEGGWGWIIVLASFFNSFIFDGIGSSFGVLYPYVHETFQASAFVTSCAGSMFGSYLIMGSVAALLIKKFGFRAVSFTGGLLGCIALVAASRCSNIYLFLLTYGVLGGASVGLVYLPSMVIVNGYFNKRRGITNGITSSGSGMGVFVMAPVINALLESYSLSGAVLILAGVLLNICVFSSCFRKPSVYDNSSSSVLSSSSDNLDQEVVDSNSEDITEESTVDNSTEYLQINKQNNTADERNSKTNSAVSNQGLITPLIITTTDDEESQKQEADVNKCRKGDKPLFHELKTNNYSLSANKLHITNDKPWKMSLNHIATKNEFGKLLGNERRSPSYHHSTCVFTDIGANSYLTGSISHLMHVHNQHFASAHQLHVATSRHDCQSLSAIPANTIDNSVSDQGFVDASLKKNTGQNLNYFSSHGSLHSNHLHSHHHISTADEVPICSVEITEYSIGQLLKMVPFYLFCLGACLIQFGYPVPNIFLADLVSAHGIPSHYGAIMISLIGSFNIGGRLLGGVLANYNLNPIRLNDVAMLFAAVLCFLCPLFTTTWSFCVFAALYGFLLGFFPPLQPLIIVKYFGIGSLASTFGFVTSLKGIAGLIGPPLAGWIYDVTSDYSISIVFAGVAFLLSVVVNETLVYITNRDIR